jgi:hypothetical protein
MKIRKFILLLFLIGLILSATSCVVVSPGHSGNHEGWNKNSNNPHHSNSTNPGNANGHNKK